MCLFEDDLFICRCINPNLKRKPSLLGRVGVMTQLKCSGMLEALQIMQVRAFVSLSLILLF